MNDIIETKKEKGLHNWKNLFKKPTFQDYIILVLLILALFMTWAYKTDLKACNDFYNNSACEICNQQRGLTSGNTPSIPQLNLSNIHFGDFKEENLTRQREG